MSHHNIRWIHSHVCNRQPRNNSSVAIRDVITSRDVTALYHGELEEPRHIVQHRVDENGKDEESGLEVVSLNEKWMSDGEEALHGNGHGRVARAGQCDLPQRQPSNNTQCKT